MAPLDGTQYVDLLFHYRPLQPELWFAEENPEHGVAPLGAVTNCREELEVIDPASAGLDKSSSGEIEEEIPRTVCTEVDTGRPVDLVFLSSPMKRITSGNDLYDEWYSLTEEAREESAPTTAVEREVHLME